MIDVEKLLETLTLEEKACLLSGHRSWYTNSVKRVGLPSITLTDGPHGLRLRREDDNSKGLGQTEPSTCFPAASTTGSSWNAPLVNKMGEAMAKECRHYGVNLILGPAVNIKRNPLCGRNFEYFSEDPLIAGSMGASLTRGIEDGGVGTSVKHFACNNKEANRYYGDSVIDERAFREIYLKAFEPIIKVGKPKTVMCAYNKVNGKYASENPELLNGILRDEWGFDGLVMSDWGAVNDRVEGLKCGLDLEMPGDIGYNKYVIVDAVKNGRLSVEALDKAVRRVLELVNSLIKDRAPDGEMFEKNAELAKNIAADSAVLMKNENNVLPICKCKKHMIVGEMFEKMRYQGAGSSLIRPYKLTTPKMAFDSHEIDYEYAKGYNVDSFEDSTELLDELKGRIADYETVIFFGGLSEYAESEGFDRKTLSLPQNQLNVIKEIANAGKKIVFVMFGGSPVDMSFDSCVDAILNMYLPGEMGGEAVYELLFGIANPSGRLVETWPISYSDVPFGDEFLTNLQDRYKESIFVGYRYYTTFGVPVKYPFGHGLSYTSFAYSNMRVEKDDEGYKVHVEVQNNGDRDGAVVLPLFVNAPKSGVVKPLRELKAFKKVFVEKGQRITAQIPIPKDALKHYIDGNWQLENGEYIFELCADADTVILSAPVTVTDGSDIQANSNYSRLYNVDKATFCAISDEDFDTLLNYKVEPIEIKRPYDLNTPMNQYKTLGGKLIYKAVMFGFEQDYKKELRAKDSPDKETRVKNAYFTWKTISVMTLRSISYGSEGRLSHKMANVILEVANNHPLRAIAKLFASEETVKLPD